MRVGLVHGSARLTPLEPGPFAPTVRRIVLDVVRIANLRAPAHSCSWSDEPHSIDPAHLVRVCFTASGSRRLTSSEGRLRDDPSTDRVDQPGSFRIVRGTASFDYVATTEIDHYAIELPIAALPPSAEALVVKTPASVVAANPLTAATVAFVVSLFDRVPTEHSDEAIHLERTLLGLISAVVFDGLADGDARQGGTAVPFPARKSDVDEALYERVVSLVSSHLTDPELSIDSIAERVNTSTRRLQRLMKTRGTTVSDLVRDTRLDAMAAEIRAGEVEGGLRSLAGRYGFSSADYVARAFRKRFGVSMSGYRSSQTD